MTNIFYCYIPFLTVHLQHGTMSTMKDSCRCECSVCKRKELAWRVIASHHNGLRVCEVAHWVNLPYRFVTAIVEDLHVDGNVYFDRRTGRWRAEMSPD